MLVCKTISGGMSGNGGAPARNPMGHVNVLIRARHDCTVRGTPLVAIGG